MSDQRRDTLFSGPEPRAGDFVFDSAVAGVFDDMVARSVPLYREQQAMVVDLARAFWRPGTTIYDLGCSTATTLLRLRDALPAGARLIGYDNSDPMLERAAEKIQTDGRAGGIELRKGDLDDLGHVSLEHASVVLLCWTLQFVSPVKRDDVLRWIWRALPDGGALIVTDKVLAEDDAIGRLFVDHYHAHKRGQGYSDHEIARKRDALEHVLIPYRIDENRALFRRNGFDIVETFFQWLNFAGFLCVKRNRPADAR
jgi:tRNA (cmo5U34)-methyltransferase